jgi:hypothetical protein
LFESGPSRSADVVATGGNNWAHSRMKALGHFWGQFLPLVVLFRGEVGVL